MNWNEGKCMASKNMNSTIRCNRKIVNDTDFCRYHYRKKNYNQDVLTNKKNNFLNHVSINKRKLSLETSKLAALTILNNKISTFKNKLNEQSNNLDDDFEYTLMDLMFSWKEVPYYKRIFINNEWWDIDILINFITTQLNSCDMENPYPVFPHSPFTRTPFSINDIVKLKKHIEDINMPINVALKVFLLAPIKKLKKIYEDTKSSDNNFSHSLLNYLSNQLRFKIINKKNSQNCYTGHWTLKSDKKSSFEHLYDKLQNTPIELFSVSSGYIRNFERDIILHYMDGRPRSNWGPTNDYTKTRI